jgi:prepilin-type N-terminal cleavage/methylation domain-containing protein/prepilin-type processing-associated H-X9-DG protein
MQCHKFGLTLIELLVVLVIVGTLIALLLPAVQHVRESARLTSCRNNLRQTALAIQTFESSHRQLPSLYNGSFIKHPRTQWDEYHFHSWQTAILPQLEQEPLHAQIDLELPATDSSNQANVNADLPVFKCPSTSNYTSVIDVFQRDPVIKVGTATLSDYEAIGGVTRDPANGGFGARMYDHIELGVWGLPRYDNSDVGTFDALNRTRFRDVSDGLSNTIIVGETAGRPDIYERGEPDIPYTVDGIDFVGQPAWAISGIFWTIALREENGVNDTNMYGLYSFHSNGANVALADGSVRTLSNETDRKVLNSLSTKAGGEMVNGE